MRTTPTRRPLPTEPVQLALAFWRSSIQVQILARIWVRIVVVSSPKSMVAQAWPIRTLPLLRSRPPSVEVALVALVKRMLRPLPRLLRLFYLRHLRHLRQCHLRLLRLWRRRRKHRTPLQRRRRRRQPTSLRGTWLRVSRRSRKRSRSRSRSRRRVLRCCRVELRSRRMNSPLCRWILSCRRRTPKKTKLLVLPMNRSRR
mmetsp:Transcript_34815/g.87578  ORF Transcript_34815/g.87578 Transcript_34815/m.87578 type:complete len:200 (+) Transcript_34815:313-912(+)